MWLVGLLGGSPHDVEQVLFEPESLLGHTPPRRQTRSGASSGIEARANSAIYNFELTAHCPQITAKRAKDNLVYPKGYGMKNYHEFSDDDSSAPLMRTGGVYGGGSETLILEPDHGTTHDTVRCLLGGHDSRVSDGANIVVPINGHTIGRIDGGSNGLGIGNADDPSFTLTTGDRHAICFIPKASAHAVAQCASTLVAGYRKSWNDIEKNGTSLLPVQDNRVRRLTPLECERLMGYPENYTRIPYRGKSAEECPDTPRYEACGNGWAINCARWVLLGIHNYLKETL